MTTETPKLQYIVLSEAWYGPANLGPKNRIDNMVDEISIGLNYPSGGTAGELSIEWIELDHKAVPHFRLFADAWHLFENPAIKALMHELGTIPKDMEITVDYIAPILEALGIEDATPRTKG